MAIALDTCIIISRKNKPVPSKHFISIVVIQELIAGAADASVVKHWITVAQQAEEAKRLLVPTVQDWIEAGKILNSHLRGLKSRNKGRTPKLPGQEKQRIIRDVLIARCVKRAGATLVTDNLKDFKMIERFCKLKIRSGREFFG
ncbi:MAG: type II toxin-antitoxin system VapC family toxin [Acidobacteriota bacterium]